MPPTPFTLLRTVTIASALAMTCSVAILAACSSSDPDASFATDAASPDSEVSDSPPLEDGSVSTDAGDSGDNVVSFPACGKNPFPDNCNVLATTEPRVGDFGRPGPFGVDIATVPNPRAGAPLPVSVYAPAGQTSVPVVFFSHAFGATKVAAYEELLRRLASNGIAGVYVPYQTLKATNRERYEQLWEGFVAATTAYAGKFDLTRVGFVGHSFGGGATPEMARRGFVEQGWGSQGRFMFIMAPWYSWGSGYDTIPTDVRTVVQVYADDEANDHVIAVKDIWNKLPSTMERGWLMIRSDACRCGLTATHTVPASASQADTTPNSKLDGYDIWGVHRRILALATYSFTKDVAARKIAYGEDTNMGRWLGCGGRSVRPLEASSSPITAACQSQIYPYSKRCDNADPGVACP